MKQFNLEDYTWEWERRAYPYYFYCFSIQWRENKFSLPVYSVMTYESGTVNAYLHKKSLDKAGKDILNKVAESGKYFFAWSEHVLKTARELYQLCDYLQVLDFSRLTDAELPRLAKQMFFAYKNHNDNVGVIRNANRELQACLQDAYADNSLIAILLSTNEKSLFTQEHEALLKIAEAKMAGEYINARLEEHTKKYFYLPCGYYGEPAYTEKDFIKKLDEILASGETPAAFDENWKNKSAERANLLKKLKPEKKLKRIVEFGSRCVYFKDFIRGNLNRLQYFNYLFFTEIAKRFGGQWTDVASLVYPEVVELLAGKRKLEKIDKMFLCSDGKGIYWFINNEAAPEIEKFKKYFVNPAETKIRGTSASPGKITGKVKIIRQLSDLGTMDEFILVSPMTTPDLMPAMKKAMAIVTDEGGLTCHAAIVSRELGIPCIIGTKIATKVLKDNDLVEVDANKGTVRKIK